MEKIIDILLSQWGVLGCWLAVELYRDFSQQKQLKDQQITITLIASNSTATLAAILEMMKSRKQREWGESVESDFEIERERALHKQQQQSKK